MKFSTLSYSALGAVLAATVNADSGCQQIAGNTYCNSVNMVNYKSVGFSGSYKKVTSFNDDGSCSSEDYKFNGNLAPLNEELSVHFRGPIQLKQFAVYYKGGDNGTSSSSNSKRDDVNIAAVGGHHVHKKREPVMITDYVHVTQTVTPGAEQQAAPTSSSAAAGVDGFNNPIVANVLGGGGADSSSTMATSFSSSSAASSSAAASSSSSSSSSDSGSSSGSSSGDGWSRTAYYNAEDSKADSLVFMNNMGGSGSGVWDAAFGNSISYADSDGTSCASSPQVLKDTKIGSNKEYMIFSSDKCEGDDCGFYRKGIPAHHGFGGDTKMFLFEFSMPKEKSGSGFNQDMPAVWFLNAQIPRTVQYGPKSCSCWATGCGEFDVFEVLDSGNDKLTNHLHTGQGSDDGQHGGGGSNDYFDRPTDGTLKAAVIFDGNDGGVSITKIGDDVKTFDSDYDIDTVKGWSKEEDSHAATVNIKTN